MNSETPLSPPPNGAVTAPRKINAAAASRVRAAAVRAASCCACLILSLLSCCLYLAACIIGVLLHLYLELPDISSLAEPQRLPALFMPSDKERASVSFLPIPPETMPEHLVQAFLAADNPRYLEESNCGAHLFALTRAMTSGGRVLYCGWQYEQDLARELISLPLPKRNFYNTLFSRELLAQKICRNFSRQEILGIFMNSAYFGDSAYGVQAAAQNYFAKPAHDLNLEESALLAVLHRSNRYNPFKYPDVARKRRDWLLERMRHLGFITTAEYEKARAAPIRLAERKLQ